MMLYFMNVHRESSLTDSLDIVSLTPSQKILSSFCLKPADVVDLINNFDNKLTIFKISIHYKIDEEKYFPNKNKYSLLKKFSAL